ncbi:unnamed protein product [Vicia faba]|uniref:Uncharacterized protein n=1 Tax=Vicia faba TaxID=3906 RepID=A0AAV1A5R4_VICFA|nr:unnamed protein product [Vicia faba]
MYRTHSIFVRKPLFFLGCFRNSGAHIVKGGPRSESFTDHSPTPATLLPHRRTSIFSPLPDYSSSLNSIAPSVCNLSLSAAPSVCNLSLFTAPSVYNLSPSATSLRLQPPSAASCFLPAGTLSFGKPRLFLFIYFNHLQEDMTSMRRNTI